MQAAIQAEHLTKQFKANAGLIQALKGVSLTVPHGTVFCILGPNGAGKTTLLRILTTVMNLDSGQAWIEGFEVGRQNIHIRKHIGIVAQENHFDRYLTIWQNLMLHAQLHGLSKPEATERITELLNQVNLYGRRHDQLDDLSGGMQRRIALIRALIHKPSVLFLDEPTTGLDPAARIEIWETIQALKQTATVILTTHYMEEADRLSDWIMILNHGQEVMSGSPDELKARISPSDTYELRLTHAHAHQYYETICQLADHVSILNPYCLRFRLSNRAALHQILDLLAPEDLKWLGLAQADLEAVYLSVASERKTGQEKPA